MRIRSSFFNSITDNAVWDMLLGFLILNKSKAPNIVMHKMEPRNTTLLNEKCLLFSMEYHVKVKFPALVEYLKSLFLPHSPIALFLIQPHLEPS